MSKKHVDMTVNVKKNFSESINSNKNAFEKDIEAININRRISAKLLFQNFKSFGEILTYAIPGIVAVYEIVKGLVHKDKPDDNDEEQQVIEETNTVINDMTKESDNFATYIANDNEYNNKQSFLDDINNKVNKNVNTMNSKIDEMVNDNKLALDDLKKNPNINFNTKTVVVGKDPAETANNLANVDLTKPAKGYMDSVNNAMSSASNDINEYIKPAYEDLNNVLSETINGFNNIFSIKSVHENDVPSVSINTEELNDEIMDMHITEVDVDISNFGQDTQPINDNIVLPTIKKVYTGTPVTNFVMRKG